MWTTRYSPKTFMNLLQCSSTTKRTNATLSIRWPASSTVCGGLIGTRADLTAALNGASAKHWRPIRTSSTSRSFKQQRKFLRNDIEKTFSLFAHFILQGRHGLLARRVRFGSHGGPRDAGRQMGRVWLFHNSSEMSGVATFVQKIEPIHDASPLSKWNIVIKKNTETKSSSSIKVLGLDG